MEWNGAGDGKVDIRTTASGNAPNVRRTSSSDRPATYSITIFKWVSLLLIEMYLPRGQVLPKHQ
jgi:hypothetical protein